VKYYKPADFKGRYPVVPEGVTFETLVKEVMLEYLDTKEYE
jgi:hypothetical protein